MINRYDAIELAHLVERYDKGVPCGGGYIAQGKKCHVGRGGLNAPAKRRGMSKSKKAVIGATIGAGLLTAGAIAVSQRKKRNTSPNRGSSLNPASSSEGKKALSSYKKKGKVLPAQNLSESKNTSQKLLPDTNTRFSDEPDEDVRAAMEEIAATLEQTGKSKEYAEKYVRKARDRHYKLTGKNRTPDVVDGEIVYEEPPQSQQKVLPGSPNNPPKSLTSRKKSSWNTVLGVSKNATKKEVNSAYERLKGSVDMDNEGVRQAVEGSYERYKRSVSRKKGKARKKKNNNDSIDIRFDSDEFEMFSSGYLSELHQIIDDAYFQGVKECDRRLVSSFLG